MHQLIIYWGNGKKQVLENESKPELCKQLDKLNLDPEQAIWEFKWVVSKAIVTESMVRAIALQGENND